MKVTMRVWTLGAMILMNLAAFGFNKSMYPYELPSGKLGAGLGCVEAKPGMKLELGKWYTNFQVCKKYADDNGLPLFAVWSNEGCVHCWYFDVCLIQEKLVEWQKKNNAGKVICCFMAGGYGSLDQKDSPAYNWMWYGGGARLNAFPFVVLWWKKGNVNYRTTGDAICAPESGIVYPFSDKTIPDRTDNVIRRWEQAFAKWVPPAEYAGGTFGDPNTAGNRLEAEAGTKSVTVTLVRDETSKTIATNNTLVVKSATGATLKTETIKWTAGQVSQTYTVDLSNAGFKKDGDKVMLYQNDLKGVSHATNSITYVNKENSAGNPKWLGESFGFGEWTMDVDAAKAKAKAASGKAYTLIAAQGSLWCPDCANTERNFLDLKDSTGANRFAAWAKKNNVALVAADTPNYKGTGDSDFASPTLLSRTAYETTLARVKEWPASGADAAMTNAMKRSGLGYLTRKGVTDAAAKTQLVKIHKLVSTNTDQGGIHRPEDGNKFRTGVPIFALLRKDGTVAARFTDFASVSPMQKDASGKEIASANFDKTIKRFDEMLAIADDTSAKGKAEIENNFPGKGSVSFKANGGTAEGELSPVDKVDTFKLDGLSGNALQKVTVKGATDAEASVAFVKVVDGAKKVVKSVSGKLSAGIALDNTFTDQAEYFVEVSGSSLPAGFHAFTLSGSVVLVPQEDKATAAAPKGSDKVMLRLKKDQAYRLKGVKVAAVADILAASKPEDSFCEFFTGIKTGDFAVTLTAAGGEIQYQQWNPGAIAFPTVSRTVTESVCDKDGKPLQLEIVRTDGKSGAVKARVSLDEENTTLDSYRFAFTQTDLVWEDGETDTKKVDVMVYDDKTFDDSGKIVLKLEVLASENGDVGVAEGKSIYTLTVNEDDIKAPGKICFTGNAEPAFARANTVYVKASGSAKVYAERIEGNDGLIGVRVKSSLAGVSFATEDPRDLEGDILYWSHREANEKYLEVKGVPAGKTARITLTSYSGSKLVSSASAVSVIAVPDSAPEFASGTGSFGALRYVAASNAYPLAAAPTGKVTFSKLSGTLPAGLKATYDAAANALSVWGVVTAKSGTYQVAYQPKDGSVAGLPIALTITVKDPTDAKAEPDFANPAVAKTRTFADLAVVNPQEKRLAGTVRVTIPTRGNVSARYACEAGLIALSATGWQSFDEGSKELTAVLTSRQGHRMTVVAAADGAVTVAIDDPEYPEVQLDAETDGKAWSKTDSAEAWKGYYTVALPVDLKSVDEDRESFAPRGTGYLTLKMDASSAWNVGRITWAGVLPNGTALSGKTLLTRGEKWAKLPLFKVSSSDVFSACAKLQAGAITKADRRSVLADDDVVPCWIHNERDEAAEAGYAVDLGIYGSIYDKTEDLGACCKEFYEKSNISLSFDVSQLGQTSFGTPEEPGAATVDVGATTLKLMAGAPKGMTLTFNRATGIVSGAVKILCADTGKTISANWKGIVLNGYGEGCGCGPGGEVVLPFVNGSYFFTDRVSYVLKTGTRETTRKLAVKRGGMVKAE